MSNLKALALEAAEDRALAQIRDAILSGALPPGTRLLQAELASRLGVSRMPVRQALLALEREGLVKSNRWHETIVAPLDANMIRDMYAFRAVVERHVAETLAQREDFDSSAIRRIVKLGRKAANAKDVNRAIELDLQFHTILYESVGNQVLSEFMSGQWAHIRRVMATTLTLPRIRERVWDEHASILDAIEAHDAPRAAREAEAHMQAAAATLLNQLSIVGETTAVDAQTHQSRRRRKADSLSPRSVRERALQRNEREPQS